MIRSLGLESISAPSRKKVRCRPSLSTRYYMRLKNVQGAGDIINKSDYIIKEPTQYRGSYNNLFGNNYPIKVEIGMGKGKFIIEQARSHPNINFIGIEKYDSVIVRAVQKLQNEDIPNLKLIRMDAREIDQIFNKEIDTLYLNFSDPWPKVRHQHRRLTSKTFLDKYLSIFKNNPTIIIKTDNRQLFEFSLISLTENNYRFEEISLDLHKDNYDNITTEYEERFIKLGQPIYMVKAIRQLLD